MSKQKLKILFTFIIIYKRRCLYFSVFCYDSLKNKWITNNLPMITNFLWCYSQTKEHLRFQRLSLILWFHLLLVSFMLINESHLFHISSRNLFITCYDCCKTQAPVSSFNHNKTFMSCILYFVLLITYYYYSNTWNVGPTIDADDCVNSHNFKTKIFQPRILL